MDTSFSDPNIPNPRSQPPAPAPGVAFALFIMTMLLLGGVLTACAPTPPPSGSTTVVAPALTTQQKVQQAFDASQQAYTLLAKVGASVITQGLVAPIQAASIRATDAKVYAALVNVRAVVRRGAQPDKVAWAALLAALREEARTAGAGVDAATSAAIDLAVASIQAVAVAMGTQLP